MTALRLLSAAIDRTRETLAGCSLRLILGAEHDPDERGLVARFGTWVLQVDSDGLMFVRATAACPHEHDEGASDDLDGPDTLTYHLGGPALHSLLEDAGIEARNGCSPSEAADKVLFEVECRYIEAGVEE